MPKLATETQAILNAIKYFTDSKLELRKKACEVAELARNLSNSLTKEDLEALEAQKVVDSEWSYKGINKIIYTKE